MQNLTEGKRGFMYISGNYKKVKDEIENRRLAAVATAELHNEEVRARSAEIREIDEELTRTGLTIFRTACRGGDLAPIRARNAELCERRRALLVSLGYGADYTEPQYACKACSDTGYVNTKMCTCLREALIRENFRTSGMGDLLTRQSFENFDVERYKRDGEDVYRRMKANFGAAKAFAENFRERKGNLFLVGTTGAGKTHLTTAIARAVLDRGFDVIYDTAQNIMAAFEHDRFRSGYQPAESRAEKYMECTLLILDDLGTEFTNAFTVSCLYNLLNERQNKGLSTVISSNVPPSELRDKYEDRIYSRLIGADYQILSFDRCSDFRLIR